MAEAGPGSIALLTVDLDDFKRVNDTYGHAAGDELLVAVAERLRTAAEPLGLAARFGGDEFAVLYPTVTGADEATALAEALSAALAAPIRLTDATVTDGASIGVALHRPGSSHRDLLRRADLAMYSAKTEGKNRVRLAVS